MQVTVKYRDDTAFVLAEVERNVKHHFGQYAEVRVEADSNKPEDVIYFGIQQLITSEQLGLLFDSEMYTKDLVNLKAEVMAQLADILNQVIIDNELKVK